MHCFISTPLGLRTTFTNQEANIAFAYGKILTEIGCEEWRGKRGKDWWQQTKKEADLRLFYLYIRLIKTEEEGNANCVEEIKKGKEPPRENSQHDKLRRRGGEQGGKWIMVKFKRPHSSSSEFQLIVVDRERVLEMRNGDEGRAEEWEDNRKRWTRG